MGAIRRAGAEVILASTDSELAFAFAGAILIGVSLGLLGSGGAILTVPILTYLVRHQDKAAIAESFLIVGAIALVGGLRAARDKGVEWWVVLFFGGAGAIGSYIGSAASKNIPGAVQLVMLGLLMFSAAYFMGRKRPAPPPATSEHGATLARHRALSLILQGAAVGVATGLTGIGGGFLIVPALVLVCKIPMHRAVGTSLCIIVINCTVGFLKHRTIIEKLHLEIDWTTVAIFSALGILGGIAGNMMRNRINQGLLRRIFAFFLLLIAAFILYREAPKVFGRPGEAVPAHTSETGTTGPAVK
jgi:uncharacterized membrane protein YfcA